MNNVTTWPENLTNNGIYNNIADATPDTSLIDPSMFVLHVDDEFIF